MIIRTGTQACLAAGFLAMALPSGAVSLASTGVAPPLPASSVQALAVAATEDVSTGSSALVPLMATDAPTTTPPATVDIPTESNASPLGKPLDDVQFVKRATESGRVETSAALGAISQLDTPRLREVAESLAADRTEANDRLSMIAESKGWPIPDIRAADTPPAGSSSSTDFDARWIADMVAGNERAAALYRAQAQGGEDPDLRKYALDTLPTIERHLAELRSLQK
jgi:putative membrane protein